MFFASSEHFSPSAQHMVLPKVKYLMKEMQCKDGKALQCVQLVVCSSNSSSNAGHWRPRLDTLALYAHGPQGLGNPRKVG